MEKRMKKNGAHRLVSLGSRAPLKHAQVAEEAGANAFCMWKTQFASLLAAIPAIWSNL
jgi:hypothetical protein